MELTPAEDPFPINQLEFIRLYYKNPTSWKKSSGWHYIHCYLPVWDMVYKDRYPKKVAFEGKIYQPRLVSNVKL